MYQKEPQEYSIDDRERCPECGKPKGREDEKGCHCEEDLDF